MMTFLYDGSFDGLLSTVFEIYGQKKNPDRILPYASYTPMLMEELVHVDSNVSKAQRVSSALVQKCSAEVLHKIYQVFLSELPERELLLYRYIRLLFMEGSSIDQDFRHPDVLRVKEINQQVNREVHRMHAFVRFRQTARNVYYSEIAPDFDVLPLIGEHFEKRYADQCWMIYDVKRQYGLYHDLEKVLTVQWAIDGSSAQHCLDPLSEEPYEDLWRNYFDAVNISERKNPKLHLRHVPKRYWKYLTEKSA